MSTETLERWIVLLLGLAMLVWLDQVLEISFKQLTLDGPGLLLLVGAMVLGRRLSLPVCRIEGRPAGDGQAARQEMVPYPLPPRARIIALNLGGAVIPGLVALVQLVFLFQAARPGPLLLITLTLLAVSAGLSRALVRPVRRQGVRLPTWIPPACCALLALLLAPEMAAPVALIVGIGGVLLGAGWVSVSRADVRLVSIGGAGMFNCVLLATLLPLLLPAIAPLVGG